MKIHAMGPELYADGRTDRQNSLFRSVGNAPIKTTETGVMTRGE